MIQHNLTSEQVGNKAMGIVAMATTNKLPIALITIEQPDFEQPGVVSAGSASILHSYGESLRRELAKPLLITLLRELANSLERNP